MSHKNHRNSYEMVAQPDGTMRTVDVSRAASDPNSVLRDVAAMEENYYNSTFRPINQQLISESNSTALVDLAKVRAAGNTGRNRLRAERQRQRYGLHSTALDRADQTKADTLREGLDYDSLVNGARLNQVERNSALRAGLLNLSRGIAGDAVSGISTAAELATQRQNTNSSIKAQNSAARTQLGGQLAGMALMLMI